MRYFLRLRYLGTNFFGWQRQPDKISVQEAIEEALSTILQEPIAITGCGRTDTGVHAQAYVAHFDTDKELPEGLLRGANTLVSSDISLDECIPVEPNAHARYHAYERSYIYTISARKDPFLQFTAWHFSQMHQLDFEKLQEYANMLPGNRSYYTFCKSNSGLEDFNCELKSAYWEKEGDILRFHITANRFLRGMVRLIVGAGINIGLGKETVDAVRTAIDNEERLDTSYSVPPEGLALTEIKYPY